MAASVPTRVVAVDPDDPDAQVIADAAEVLRAGGLVAFATETVYGLGADATSATAVEQIFTAKGRPAYNPLIVHVDGIAMAQQCVAEWPDVAAKLAEAIWPGPLTLVLRKAGNIPDNGTAGLDTVALRVPDSAVALALIQRLGRPIAAPSANRSTRLSPTTAEHVLKDLGGRIELILDSGPTTIGLESTVLDLTGPEPYRILRPGPLSGPDLFDWCRIKTLSAWQQQADEPARSPGQMPVHYAPRTPTIWIEPGQITSFQWPERAACLVLGRPEVERSEVGAQEVFRVDSFEEASRSLYATLHAWDVQGFSAIVVIAPPDRPEWWAIRDRLRRASQRAE